jgi:hypothetical protein
MEIGQKLSAISYQLSAISYQLRSLGVSSQSTVHSQQIIGRSLKLNFDCQLSTVNCHLWPTAES